MSKLRTAFNRFRGHPVEDDLSAYLRTVRMIREFHESAALDGKADGEIGRLAAALRTRFDRTAAFALAIEAARRATGLAAHDVQIVAALANDKEYAFCGRGFCELMEIQGLRIHARQ